MLLSDQHPEHKDLIAFGDHCTWAWACHQIAKLYCDDPDIIGWCEIDSQLATILKENALLQIAKIHDPVKSCGHVNHTMRQYCKQYGCSYEDLIGDSAAFIDSVLQVRKKIIAHNDLETMRSGNRLGAYGEGDDDLYFSMLHSAMNALYEKAGIAPFPDWPEFITTDASLSVKRMHQITERSSGTT